MRLPRPSGPVLVVLGVACLLGAAAFAAQAAEGRRDRTAIIAMGGNEGTHGGLTFRCIEGIGVGGGQAAGVLAEECLAMVELEHPWARIRLESDRPVTLAALSAAAYGQWLLGGPMNATVVIARNVTAYDARWSIAWDDVGWPKPLAERDVPTALARLNSRLHLSGIPAVLVVLPEGAPPTAMTLHVLEEQPGAGASAGAALGFTVLGATLAGAGAWRLRAERRRMAEGEPGPVATLRALLERVERWLFYRQLVPAAVALLVVLPAALALWTFGAGTHPQDWRGPLAALDQVGASPAADPATLALSAAGAAALVLAWVVLVRDARERVGAWRRKLAAFRADEEGLVERL